MVIVAGVFFFFFETSTDFRVLLVWVSGDKGGKKMMLDWKALALVRRARHESSRKSKFWGYYLLCICSGA